MQIVLLWLLLAPVGIWLILSIGSALLILRLARLDLENADEAKSGEILEAVFAMNRVESSWLAQNGFESKGVFRTTGGQLGEPYIVVWQHGGDRTYLCIYVLTRVPFGMSMRVPRGARTNFPIGTNFVTLFQDGMLSTGGNRDGQTLPPRPGRFIQTLSGVEAKELWAFHQAGLEFLRNSIGQVAVKTVVDFREDFVSNIRAHMAYIRSLPFWFLKVPYWTFVLPFSMHNKSVRAQYEQLH